MFINDPKKIEDNSMDIIDQALGQLDFNQEELQVAKRIIHTTGDLDYQSLIYMSKDFVKSAKKALEGGTRLYLDTKMTKAGINKKAKDQLGLDLVSYIDHPDIAKEAKEKGTTRSYAAIKRAIREGISCFSIGNAPTALYALLEEVDKGNLKVDFVIGVPVGFVGAAESKEALMSYKNIPQISIRGNKGGSNVAASIVNALMYLLVQR